MKWNQKNNEGDKRIVNRFLWLPKTIGSQTRWLEHVPILQVYRESVETYTGYDCGSPAGWCDVDWDDET